MILSSQTPLSEHDTAIRKLLVASNSLTPFNFQYFPSILSLNPGYTIHTQMHMHIRARTFPSRLSSSLARVGFGDRPGSHRLSRHRAHGMIYHSPFVISRVHLTLRPRRFITLTILRPRSHHRRLSLMHCYATRA